MEYLLILWLWLIFSAIFSLWILYIIVAITTYIEMKQRNKYFKENPEEKNVYYCWIIINENDEIEKEFDLDELMDELIKSKK